MIQPRSAADILMITITLSIDGVIVAFIGNPYKAPKYETITIYTPAEKYRIL